MGLVGRNLNDDELKHIRRYAKDIKTGEILDTHYMCAEIHKKYKNCDSCLIGIASNWGCGTLRRLRPDLWAMELGIEAELVEGEDDEW